MRRIFLAAVVFSCLLLAACGGAVGAMQTCTIVAAVMPVAATADHNAAAPANQAQFTASSSVTGNCPMLPDRLGSWSTSDTTNTSISNTPPTQGLATCHNSTAAPATIHYSGTARGHAFTDATLSCK